MNVLSHTRRFAAATLAAGILILCSGTSAVAATSTPTPDPATTTSASGDDRDGSTFYSGVFIDVSGDIVGDVYASGQSITISGDVTGDVIAAAQTITITGTVDGDVRLAGQSVTVSGNVSRSGTIFAGDIIVTDTGSLGDDLVGAAGTLSIAGEVGRDVLLSVGRLTIDGSVGGNVTYYSDSDARIAEGAVDGTVERLEPPRTPAVEVSPWAVFVGWFLGLLYALVALSLITVLAGLLFPRWLQRVTDHLVPSPWKALLVGFVAFISVPLALLFLLVTIVGAPLALAGMLVWVVLTLATFVYGAHYIGRLLLRGAPHPVVKTLVGGLILIVALQVPWLNILVWLAMVFFGLGAQLLEFHRQRPWTTRAEADAALRPPLIPVAGDPTPPNPVHDERGIMPTTDIGPRPNAFDIEAASLRNENYRTVAWTGRYLQVTLMTIPVGGSIGLEAHPGTDQFLRIDAGQGRAVMGAAKDQLDFEQQVSDGWSIQVPAGTWHDVINTGTEPLRLYTVYAPTHHAAGTVQATSVDAERDESAGTDEAPAWSVQPPSAHPDQHA